METTFDRDGLRIRASQQTNMGNVNQREFDRLARDHANMALQHGLRTDVGNCVIDAGACQILYVEAQ